MLWKTSTQQKALGWYSLLDWQHDWNKLSVKLHFSIAVLSFEYSSKSVHNWKKQNRTLTKLLMQHYHSTQSPVYTFSKTSLPEPNAEYTKNSNCCYLYRPLSTHPWHLQRPHLHASQTAWYRTQANYHMQTHLPFTYQSLLSLHRCDIAVYAFQSNQPQVL